MNEMLSGMRDLIRRQPYHLLLPFLGVWLIKPYYGGTRADWTGLAIALPLFLIFYALAHLTRPPARFTELAALTLLGAAYVPVNPEASGIFSFVAAIYAAERLRVGVLWGYLLGINLLLLAETLWFHLNLWTWMGGGSGAVLFSCLVVLNARERETNLQLRLAQNEIGRLAGLAERERITRDLHDVLGHTLSLIALKSELAQKRFPTDPGSTLMEAQEIEVLSREALVRVRGALHGYLPVPIAQEAERISAALTSAGLKVMCNVDATAIDPMQEAVLAMVLREASTNIIRHAHAGFCEISLRRTLDAVYLSIADDGRGSADYSGFGLRGMQERLRLLGGSLKITGGNGTRIQAILPCAPSMPKVMLDS